MYFQMQYLLDFQPSPVDTLQNLIVPSTHGQGMKKTLINVIITQEINKSLKGEYESQ